MRVYLQTRGRNLDYAFLGQTPKERWWSQYLDRTMPENPTILVRSDGQKWHVYLSGIGSTRRKDRVGTTIRYTLVFEGECSDEQARKTARIVVGSWLENAAGKQPSDGIQAALDIEFEEPFVEQTLNARSAEAEAEVSKRVKAALSRLSAGPSEGRAIGESGSWLGSVQREGSRKAFMGRVQALLGGEAGRALLLNLIGIEDAERAVQDKGGPAAILILDEAGALGSDTVSLEEKKKREEIQRQFRQQVAADRPGSPCSPSSWSSSPFSLGSYFNRACAEGQEFGTFAQGSPRSLILNLRESYDSEHHGPAELALKGTWHYEGNRWFRARVAGKLSCRILGPKPLSAQGKLRIQCKPGKPLLCEEILLNLAAAPYILRAEGRPDKDEHGPKHRFPLRTAVATEDHQHICVLNFRFNLQDLRPKLTALAEEYPDDFGL